jgi:hypothetical protein
MHHFLICITYAVSRERDLMMDDVRCVEGIIQAFSGWTEEKHSAT